MISKFQLFAAALAGVLVCPIAGAQVSNGSSAARPLSGHARPAARTSAKAMGAGATASQSTRQSDMVQISPGGQVPPEFARTANLFSFDGSAGVPGLGFDFPHLAAISGALGKNPSLHFGHRDFRGQVFFVPILFGGYPYYSDDLSYDQPEQQMVQQPQAQPQISVIQQPVPAQQTRDAGSDTGNPSAAVTAPLGDVPVPDVGNFILVRRDGRVLFASVFSVVGSELQYVTPEGIRRTVAISDLDADATQQMNEARGTTVQIHN